jgi:hypothetical protein
MIDQGFTRIANMSYGLADRQQRKYPVVNQPFWIVLV